MGQGRIPMREPHTEYLTITHPHGTRELVVIAEPGKGMRLAVGSPDRRSSTWRAGANRNDVYITAAGLGQSVKFSLHESGIWRLAFVTEELALNEGALGLPEFNNDPRVLDRWEEPAGNNGWMQALTVWVPHDSVTPLKGAGTSAKKPVTWLRMPAEGEEVGIHFVVVRPHEGILDAPPTRFLGGFRLPNGRAFLALSSTRRLEPSRARWYRDVATHGLISEQEQGRHLDSFGEAFRLGLFGRERGVRTVTEIRGPEQDEVERFIREGRTVDMSYTAPLEERSGS